MPKGAKRKKTTVTGDKNRQYRRNRIKEQLLANYQNKTQGITAIIGQRENEGVEEYKVRWGGKYCRVTFDSWVPHDKLDCPDLIKNFHETLEEMLTQEDYIVEKILEERTVEGKREFLVQWEEWSAAYNSWEPEEHLEGCDVAMKFYTDWRDKSGEWLQILQNMEKKSKIARVYTRQGGRIFYQPLEGGKHVEITCEKDLDLLYARVKELEEKGKIIKIRVKELEEKGKIIKIRSPTPTLDKTVGHKNGMKSEIDNKLIPGKINKEMKSPTKTIKSTKVTSPVKNNITQKEVKNNITPKEDDHAFLVKISLLNCAVGDIGCPKCKKKTLHFKKYFEKKEKLQTYNIAMCCKDCGEIKLLCLASCKSR